MGGTGSVNTSASPHPRHDCLCPLGWAHLYRRCGKVEASAGTASGTYSEQVSGRCASVSASLAVHLQVAVQHAPGRRHCLRSADTRLFATQPAITACKQFGFDAALLCSIETKLLAAQGHCMVCDTWNTRLSAAQPAISAFRCSRSTASALAQQHRWHQHIRLLLWLLLL